jgi:hypothetical protein
MCAKLSLSAQRLELGVEFTSDSPYLVPGFLAHEDSKNEAGGICLLFTTFHLTLNYVRAAHWFHGQVTLAFDHTFKMDVKGRSHFTINVMVRNAATPPPSHLSLPSCVCVMCSSKSGCGFLESITHLLRFTTCVVHVQNNFSVHVVNVQCTCCSLPCACCLTQCACCQRAVCKLSCSVCMLSMCRTHVALCRVYVV